MKATNHYQERIERATRQLAQLQARELLANHRQTAKMKNEKKRAEIRRRGDIADIVFATGAHTLSDETLARALQDFMRKHDHLIH
ncbi:MAG TPA: hypothetical protein DEO93_01975 [Stenotrophomonas sp.]|jgi:GH24 family phage-related lysozyme (muramidase)|nr:hypothetical protein [Stenotrophomonas sp.]